MEGDTLHPAANITKMAAGMPLDDEDRVPFLDNVAQAIAESRPQASSCPARPSSAAIVTGSRVNPRVAFVLPF